jgi:hypothetical protein
MMKPKHFTKNLSLSKQTIARLGDWDLQKARAGEQTTQVETMGIDSCPGTYCRSVIPGIPCTA